MHDFNDLDFSTLHSSFTHPSSLSTFCLSQLLYLVANNDGSWSSLNHTCPIKSNSELNNHPYFENELVISFLEGNENNSNIDSGLEE